MKTLNHGLALVTALAIACGPGNDANDAGTTDVPTSHDATPTDVAQDHETPTDTTAPDASQPDATVVDVAQPDSGVTDVPGDTPTTDAACGTWTTAPTVDATLAIPADAGTQRVVLHASATGTQNYACTATATAGDGGTDDAGTTYAWTFVGPVAELRDCAGATIGVHFASPAGAAAPEWESLTDGSSVIGHRLAAATPDATAVPWLLLGASSHAGTGVLANVQYVHRVHTVGGIAPTTGCDATHVGAVQNVSYTADYFFYAP